MRCCSSSRILFACPTASTPPYLYPSKGISPRSTAACFLLRSPSTTWAWSGGPGCCCDCCSPPPPLAWLWPWPSSILSSSLSISRLARPIFFTNKFKYRWVYFWATANQKKMSVLSICLSASLALFPPNGPNFKGNAPTLPLSAMTLPAGNPPRYQMNQSTIIMPCNNSVCKFCIYLHPPPSSAIRDCYCHESLDWDQRAAYITYNHALGRSFNVMASRLSSSLDFSQNPSQPLIIFHSHPHTYTYVYNCRVTWTRSEPLDGASSILTGLTARLVSNFGFIF